MTRKLFLTIGLLAVAACGGNSGPTGLFPEEGRGPDEFSVVPSAPLELPEDFANLPEPTPGAPSRADLNPNADAVAALGGRATASGGIPASDAAFVAYVGRAGVDASARTANQGSAGRLFGLLPRRGSRDVIDPFAEADRFRAAGVRVPTAPPN